MYSESRDLGRLGSSLFDSLLYLSRVKSVGKDLNNLQYVYTIDISNGEIYKRYKTEVKSYDHFPAFSSFDEAVEAKSICRHLTNKLYGQCKSKD